MADGKSREIDSPSGLAQLDRLQALRFIAAAAIVVRHVFMELEQRHQFQLDGIPSAGDSVGRWRGRVLRNQRVRHHIRLPLERSPLPALRVISSSAGLIRLWPTYALFTVLMLIAMAVIPGMLNHPTIDPAHTVASFAFIPWPEPGDGLFFPVLGQGWTLNYEMFFYACFAATMLAPSRFLSGDPLGGWRACRGRPDLETASAASFLCRPDRRWSSCPASLWPCSIADGAFDRLGPSWPQLPDLPRYTFSPSNGRMLIAR